MVYSFTPEEQKLVVKDIFYQEAVLAVTEAANERSYELLRMFNYLSKQMIISLHDNDSEQFAMYKAIFKDLERVADGNSVFMRVLRQKYNI